MTDKQDICEGERQDCVVDAVDMLLTMRNYNTAMQGDNAKELLKLIRYDLNIREAVKRAKEQTNQMKDAIVLLEKTIALEKWIDD